MNYVKLLLGLVVVVICTITGIKLSERYKLRRNFYAKFLNFNRRLSDEVSFTKNSLPKIIENVDKTDAFGQFVADYFDYIVNNNQKNYKYLWFLTDDEKKQLETYISSLGKTDTKSQLDFLKSNDEKLKIMLSNSETDEKKYKTLYMKMGFLTGVLILVLIM